MSKSTSNTGATADEREGESLVVERDTLNIVERMSRVMAEVSAVGKTGQNREQGYSFRSIDEFMNSLHGPLARWGVAITPKLLDRQISERERRNGGITRLVDVLVEYTFHSPDGTSLTTITAGEGADVADKATNKAMAGALKYAIMQTFMVPTRDMQDGDSETPDVPSQRESQRARDERVEQQQTPPRDQIMAKLEESAAALGQTPAKTTEKWRRTHDVGPYANIDTVSDVDLYRFVVSLQPYVEQAKRQNVAGEPDDESRKPDESVPEPTPDERAAAARDAAQLCTATQQHPTKSDETQRCTKAAGHDGEHGWW